MSKDAKQQYNKVVHDSLVEKGYKPIKEPTIWTYYMREAFKRAFGLTWFNGQWWCPNTETHTKILAIANEMDRLAQNHFSDQQRKSLASIHGNSKELR